MTAFAIDYPETTATGSPPQLSPTIGYYVRKLLRQRGVAAPIDPTADLGIVLRQQYPEVEDCKGAIATLERLVRYHQALASQGSQHHQELAKTESDIFKLLEGPGVEGPGAATAASSLPSIQQGLILRIDERGEDSDPLSSLLRQRGYHLHLLPNQLTSVMEARRLLPDVIVIEIKMLEGGLELCRQLRTALELKQVPILMVSTLHSVSDRLKALRLGVTDYLPQPVQPDELLARIENHWKFQQYRKQLEATNQQLQAQLEAQSGHRIEPLLLAQAVLNQNSDYMLFVDAQNQIVHVNQAACERLEYNQGELLAMSLDTLDVRLAPQDWQTIWQHLRAHATMNLKSVHVTKSGTPLDVQLDFQYLRLEDSEYSYIAAKQD